MNLVCCRVHKADTYNPAPSSRPQKVEPQPSKRSEKNSQKNASIGNNKDASVARVKQPAPYKKENQITPNEQYSSHIADSTLWIILILIGSAFMAVLTAKSKPAKEKQNRKILDANSTKQKAPDIDNSITTKPPNKRLLKNISYAHEKAEIEQDHNGTEYEIPQKYLRTKYQKFN